MQTYFVDNKSQELLLFLSGWGMDERPFLDMQSSRDILFVHNYGELELEFDFSRYEKIVLLTYSYGVFIADYLEGKLPVCDYKIAFNGTLFPIHNEFGIPERIFSATLEKINESNYMKFRKRLFTNEEHFAKFNANEPHRMLEDSRQELAMLKKCTLSNKKEKHIKYDKVLIAKSDKIIPTANQANYWQEHPNVHFIEGGHFNFYNFEGFDDIINL